MISRGDAARGAGKSTREKDRGFASWRFESYVSGAVRTFVRGGGRVCAVIYRSLDWRSEVKRFATEAEAATATEYAIMLAVLVLGSMAVIQSIGESFRGIYLVIASKIPEAR